MYTGFGDRIFPKKKCISRSDENMIGRIGRKRPKGIKRIHVGCGHTRLADWWNVDRIKYNAVDECIDVLKKWPYKNIEYIYCEHFIEHLRLHDFLRFMKRAGNSLAAGGIIRMTTPNLKWVIATHFKFGKGFDATINYTIRTNMAFYGWNHRFLFTEEILELILKEMCFEKVTFHTYGESDKEELKGLESHPGYKVQEGFPSQLCIEATRGTRPIRVPKKLTKVDLIRFFKNMRPESY
jgi:predicted SAM-dependent methyltransferase